MNLSVFVAKILALTYIAFGIAAVSGKVTFEKMLEDFERSPALAYVTGFFTLVLGMLLVQYHNVWTCNWTVLITLIGWISLIKGIMLIAFPQYMSLCKGWYKNTRGWGIFMIAFGALFAYFGFIA